jgi:RimJ/RimL family protein N-acetyltransferase
MFVFDLDSMPLESRLVCLPNAFVKSYETLEGIPRADKDQLIRLKSKEILDSHLHHFFEKGATLWIAKIDQKIVGLCWTLIGGFDGFYSIPMTSRDAIYLAAEVFPEFRGQGIATAIRLLVYSQLRQQGVSRVFAKVHVANVPSLKSLTKTGNQQIGIVRTFRIFGKHITIWE